MTCSLYKGTLAYHPTCTTGYSYYYNRCCSVNWYITWNVIMWLLVALVLFAIILIVRRWQQAKVALRKKYLQQVGGDF